MSETVTLKEVLKTYTMEGDLHKVHEDNSLTCFACGHRCLIRDGRDGICRVRFNEGGKLYVPANYAGGIQCDPTEKKPFFHAYPGSLAVTFGMLGCDYHCSYCQNWVTSQALRDPKAVVPPQEVRPLDLIILGKKHNAKLIVSSYNEPLITSEWAMKIFREAKKEGFVTGYVSNGNATPEVLDYIRPHTDLYKIDLKSFNDKNYRKLGGVLQHVLDTIGMVYERGFWTEVVSLLVPGFNDSDGELKSMAKFLMDISPNIPWHVTAFHQDYKMRDPDNTPVETLIRAAEIGYEAGLNFVYAGNLPGRVGKYEHTYCPNCHTALIKRFGFHIIENKIEKGKCYKCHTEIPGRWEDLEEPVNS
ncbi:AmmeMemoRadiSam system radical SAM enzyme [candidate division KSB1 bacterium]|nr:AmmeMemoRadiSam system radical SAM enzyme [candidate division KSB1 bacterium]NIR69633.1 AmmeMemoRadiSam system radical SAM enzyme [candidate division KSB1 bacterium]NIS25740.1 AmmeMemoRadiSam system radical SAM enzyme [candidate division KSB1 bacterium]NIT72609.1 AmmeMemoRadiSam system radical SAM enzyme [candidate division KSB1 bacterium]NIU26421.1 AmmeMemoRadiSam system radical SAM enzyme [candidate division KSB1 bacterium]